MGGLRSTFARKFPFFHTPADDITSEQNGTPRNRDRDSSAGERLTYFLTGACYWWKETKEESGRRARSRDKAQHSVLLDKATSEKLYKDVQSYRLVTIATLVDRMKINGSLARQCLNDLEEKGMIKPVVTHSKMKIYSMSSSDVEEFVHMS